MSQGKQTHQEQSDEQKEIEFEIELPNEMCDELERLGDGDINEGAKIMVRYYREHNEV